MEEIGGYLKQASRMKMITGSVDLETLVNGEPMERILKRGGGR